MGKGYAEGSAVDEGAAVDRADTTPRLASRACPAAGHDRIGNHSLRISPCWASANSSSTPAVLLLRSYVALWHSY